MVNVLAIPEDCRLDQHILRPLLPKVLAAAGFPRATIRVCLNPRLGGVSEALDESVLAEIVRMYPMVDLFLLVVDRDCQAGRLDRLRQLEGRMSDVTRPGQTLIGVAAIQELEVWVLAGMDDFPSSGGWRQVLDECHPKETYFDPYAAAKGVADAVGRGRRPLAQEAARRFSRVRSRCEEDVGDLVSRVTDALS